MAIRDAGADSESDNNSIVGGGDKKEKGPRERYNDKIRALFPKYVVEGSMGVDLSKDEILIEIENILRLKEYTDEGRFVKEYKWGGVINDLIKRHVAKEKQIIKLGRDLQNVKNDIESLMLIKRENKIDNLQKIDKELLRKTRNNQGKVEILTLVVRRVIVIKKEKLGELENDLKKLGVRRDDIEEGLKKAKGGKILSIDKMTKDVLENIYLALLKGNSIVDKDEFKNENVNKCKIELYQAQHIYNAALGGWTNRYTNKKDELPWTLSNLFPRGYKVDVIMSIIPYEDGDKYPYMQSRYLKCSEKAKSVDENLSKIFGKKTNWAKDLLYGMPFKNIQNALTNNLLVNVAYTTDTQKTANIAQKSKIKERYKKRATARRKLFGENKETDTELRKTIHKQILEEQARRLVKELDKDDLLKDIKNISLDDYAGGGKIKKDEIKIKRRQNRLGTRKKITKNKITKKNGTISKRK